MHCGKKTGRMDVFIYFLLQFCHLTNCQEMGVLSIFSPDFKKQEMPFHFSPGGDFIRNLLFFAHVCLM